MSRDVARKDGAKAIGVDSVCLCHCAGSQNGLLLLFSFFMLLRSSQIFYCSTCVVLLISSFLIPSGQKNLPNYCLVPPLVKPFVRLLDKLVPRSLILVKWLSGITPMEALLDMSTTWCETSLPSDSGMSPANEFIWHRPSKKRWFNSLRVSRLKPNPQDIIDI